MIIITGALAQISGVVQATEAVRRALVDLDVSRGHERALREAGTLLVGALRPSKREFYIKRCILHAG